MTESAYPLRDRIDAVANLPTSFAVAVRVIELCRDPEVGCFDLAKLVATDPSLSSRFLSLTNSAWFGMHKKITRVSQAVSLLGIANVRAVSVTHSLTGLYHGWKLDDGDAKAYWQAALLKAAAGELLTQGKADACSEETFTLGLLQDIGVGLMVSCGEPKYGELLRDEEVSLSECLEFEQANFKMDHAECGALLAERIGLPQPFPEAIRIHHAGIESMDVASDEPNPIGFVISLLPHDLRNWNKQDFQHLDRVIREQFGQRWEDAHQFTEAVQQRFTALTELVTGGCSQIPSLEELTARACLVLSQANSNIVLDQQSLSVENQNLTRHMLATETKHRNAEVRATHDTLTGLLNRDGFGLESAALLKEARASGRSVALAMLDLDGLKQINDEHGHACGDHVLQIIARRLTTAVRGQELICRWGGDEILIMLEGLPESESVRAVQRLTRAVEGDAITWREIQLYVTVSVGVEWVKHISGAFDLDTYIERVDAAMYQDKRSNSRSSSHSPASS